MVKYLRAIEVVDTFADIGEGCGGLQRRSSVL